MVSSIDNLKYMSVKHSFIEFQYAYTKSIYLSTFK